MMTTTAARSTGSISTLTTNDHDSWRSSLPAARSVFGSVEFASIRERHLGHRALLLIYAHRQELVGYPIFLRPLSELPFAAGHLIQAWDSVSPEYTGPIALGDASHQTAAHFSGRVAEYCQKERIIAEFAHLHPWNHFAHSLATPPVPDREIVYVDLAWPEDQLWQSSFSYPCRKNIKRALREGVRVFPATTMKHVKEFHRIYLKTMERNKAQAHYYFPLDYFVAFFEKMPDNCRFALAEHKGQIIAGTLFLHDDTDVYSYLGGADDDFQQVRPTNTVVYETIQWSKQQGKQRLILGGGYQPDDGIFRFKASFSPLRATFHTYRRIHHPQEYEALCCNWSVHYQTTLETSRYFPAYRSVPLA